MSKLKKYFFLILIISIKICINEKSIILPFKSYKESEDEFLSKDEFFKLKEDNVFFSSFKIGNPPKEIPAFYTLYNSSLSIHSNLNILSYLKSDYIPSKSKSFSMPEYDKVQDELTLNIENEEIVKNFTFLFQTQNKNDKNLYINIGLQNFYKELTTDKFDSPNFLYQLKKYGLIDSITFSINYTSETEGFINVNIEPFEYAPEIYSKKKRHIVTVKGVTSKAINKLGEYLWSMDINTLYYENKEGNMQFITEEHYNFNEDQYYAILNPGYGVIKGPYIYKKMIEKDFFNDLKEREICILNREHKKLFYTCKSNYKNEIKDTFPTLYFYHHEFNYSFELNFDDLFYEKNGNLYFLICFDTGMFGDDKFTEISEWIFGKPFLKKYQFSFDVEKRRIIFYENLKRNINNSNKNVNIKKYIYLNHLISFKNLAFIIFFLFIISFAFYKTSKYLKNNNKIIKRIKDEKEEESIELEETMVESQK